MDDNIFNVMTLEMMINHSLNQQVDKALNGKEAVDQFLKRAAMDPCHCHRSTPLPYQLVFMDCNMPVMDGFQATAEIRRLFPDSTIHIVALTAYCTEEFKDRCLLSGMDTFMTKPVSEESI